MAVWNEEETLKLIEIWDKDSIQAMVEGSKRNKYVFNKISRKMEAAGYEKTADQCNNKIRKLKLEYRKIKDSTKKTGTGRKDWRYFEEMDALLGHKPATQLPVVVESGEAAATDSPAGDEEGESVAKDTAKTKPDESESSSSRSGTTVDIKTQPKGKEEEISE